MIRVNLEQTAPAGGYSAICEMPAVPREGDTISLTGSESYSVMAVIWTPNEPDYDVLVRFR